VTPLADDSALLADLHAAAEQGRHREVLERLQALPATMIEGSTAFALLAAEAHGRLGGYAEAQRWTDLALVVARARGERQAELRALNYRGAIALSRGDVDAAERLFAEAVDLARAVQDHLVEARCLNNLGIIAFFRGQIESALASYHLALAAYQQAGLVRGMAETHHNIGNSWRHRGDHRRALESADQAVRLATQLKDDSLLGLALMGRAETHLLMGDLELAAAELERVAQAYGRVHFEALLPELWRLQAAVARARGDLPGARRLLERASEFATTQGAAEMLAAIERDLGAALEASGDRAGARAARERAAALYRKLGALKAAGEIAALIT
jgi:tetratricopeptide (TPR) repeat protein